MSTDTLDQPTETQDETPAIDPVIKMQLDHLDRILDSQKDVDALARALESAKATAKEARSSWEHAVEQHGSIVRENPDQLPLFSDDADEEASDWREIPLEDVAEITAAQLKVLSGHDPSIKTLGQLADWTKSEGPQWWSKIDGLGEVGAVNVDCATLKWWGSHLEYCPDEMDEDDQGDHRGRGGR